MVEASTVHRSSQGKYAVTTFADTTCVVTKADITLTGFIAANKVYDATTAATLVLVTKLELVVQLHYSAGAA